MAGYCRSKTATSWLMFGTQVQNVSVVGVFIALSISAWLTVAVFVAADELEPELEQASRTRPPAAAAVAARNVRRLNCLCIVRVLLMFCVVLSCDGSGARARARRNAYGCRVLGLAVDCRITSRCACGGGSSGGEPG